MRFYYPLCIVLVVVGLSHGTAWGQIFDWNNASGGSYDSVFNWTPIGVPDTASESARFDIAGTYTVAKDTSGDTVLNFDVLDGNVTLQSANINKTINVNSTTTVSGGDFTLARPSSGAIIYNTAQLSVNDSSTMTVENGNTLTVDGFFRLGDDSTFTPGTLLVEGGSTLDMDQGAQLFVGSSQTATPSSLTISGAGTTSSGAVSIVVGNSAGRGSLRVVDNAVATHHGANLSVSSGFDGYLEVSGGATLSVADELTSLIGSTTIEDNQLRVEGAARFEAGFFTAQNCNVVVDGLGTVMRVRSYDVTSANVTVSGGATLEIEAGGSGFYEGNGLLRVSGGSTITGSAIVLAGSSTGGTARVQIDSGSQWLSSPEFVDDFGLSLGAGTDAVAELIVDGGGTVLETGNGELSLSTGQNSSSEARFSNGAAGTVNNFTMASGADSTAELTIDDATLIVEGDAELSVEFIVGEIVERGQAHLTLMPDALLDLRGDLILGSNSAIEMFGGELRVRELEDIQGTGGSFNWNNGVVRATGTGTSTLTPFAATILTPTGSLAFGQELEVNGTLELETTLSLDGGRLSLLGIVGSELLQLNSGVFEFLDDNLIIGPGGPIGESFEMSADLTLVNDNDVVVDGLLIGRGTIDAFFGVSTSGELRIGSGDRMTVTQSAGNSGLIELTSGRLDAQSGFTNNATGNIVGRGILDIGGSGLTNRGDLAFSNGQSDVFGDVSNQTTGRVIVSGNADITFWDDVSHTGAMFNVSSGSSVTFFGTAGFGVSGGGDVFFEADVTPGSSPGLESFGGDVYFGVLSNLVIDLAGTASGTEFDRLEVAGNTELNGSLEVLLLDTYAPMLGDVFEFLSAGGISGEFSSLLLPALNGGLGWEVRYSPTNVDLIITSALAGDYNNDGTVNLADYTVWRNNLGAPAGTLLNDVDGVAIGPAQYATWKTNFGATLQAASVASSAVPEPDGVLLVICGIVLMAARLTPRERRASPGH